ncbi:cytochrome C biosynthesis protein [Erythrobacter alti]|uniref:cytochrome C biosynthesis protein n=1 Tax=Erythrobacter alti TaxID=1896145 RepID=UPI0030F437C3
MIWLLVALLALAVLVASVLAFRIERALWTTFAAALTFGLAGYAWQASPDLPSAPKSAQSAGQQDNFDIVAQRREFVAENEQSRANMMFTADGMARRGQYSDASEFLNGITRDNPRDFEAWLALGNALVEHADGALTAPALYAYQQAATLAPEHPAPGYFLGVALIRQGRLMEARGIWTEALANAPEDAAGRAGLQERLQRLDAMLGAMGGSPAPAAPVPATTAEGE